MDRPIEILMVDDNPGDARLTLEAMKELGMEHRFQWVDDGDKALLYLRRQPPFAGAIRPDLILLDLNLPRKDGRELLAEIKTDPDLKRIPVIVLTTSQAEEDVRGAYHSYANCYINKPVTLEQFIDVVRSIQQFWCTLARLPIPGNPTP